jgi:hypothetical protein
MSYIIKKNDALVNVKLTTQGRRNLAAGNLTFTNFILGDSEMDYSSDDKPGVNILRPSDNQIGLSYPIGATSNLDIIRPITIVNSIPNEVYAKAKERGFFNYTGTTKPEQTLCSLYNITGTTNGTTDTISFNYTSNSQKNETYIDLKPGDFVFVKYEKYDYTTGTTYTQSEEITTKATQYLWYIVETISTADSGDNQTLTGVTNGSTITITLDRELPIGSANLTAFIYPGKDTIKNYYDEETPVAYWQGGLLDFSNNNTQSNLDVPVWNMNIIHIEDVIGLDSVDDKSKYDTISNTYLGASINYGNYDTNSKIGIIHYTNNTVSNFYGEGFKQSTMKLKIPYLMWHKKQYTGTTFNEIGYTFVTDTELKTLTSSSSTTQGTFQYYDLVDEETNKNVVGKVFIDEKVILIEDPELLTVLSYKANRNWTLPKPKLTLTEPGICGNTSTMGVLQPGEYLYVSYLLGDTNGITGMHCEDYTVITNSTNTPKDVLFEFNKKTGDPNYSEFSYLTDYDDTTGLGYKVNQLLLLWQKSETVIKPDSANWSYTDMSNYLGTNGCVTGVMNIDGTNFELHADIFDYATDLIPTHSVINTTLFDVFELGDKPVGEIIVIYDGEIQKEATDDTLSDGTYYHHPEAYATGPNGKSVIVFSQGYGTNNDLLQIYYLIGKSNTAKTVKQVINVPSQSVINSNTNSDSIYKSTIAPNRVSLKLNKQPNNSTVWLFYKGMLLSSNTYGVFVTNETIDDRRVELNFTPTQGSEITIIYLDNSGLGQTVSTNVLTKDVISALRVNIDQNILDNSELDTYILSDYINIPTVTETSKHTFGDEVFFYGNIETDIKATIYKTQLTCNVLPNHYITTTNPTFNVDQDKVAFTEIAITSEDQTIVAIGKFSEPITRKYNSDMLVLQVTIDF